MMWTVGSIYSLGGEVGAIVDGTLRRLEPLEYESCMLELLQL